ncbi:amidohydrolase [Aeromicrobium sp.]|uniref:amidohydrolase n=1 Tax=Aeromicrobium sp. TaxID=1871063 RepID=UPI003D6B0084
MTGLLVRGGLLLGTSEPVDVAIDSGGRIAAVTPHEPGAVDAVEVVDARECLVLPGLVEAHCHLDKTLFGREWVPHSAGDALSDRIANDRLRRTELGIPDYASMESLVTAMSGFGTTTIRTHTDVDPDVGLDGVIAVQQLSDDMSGRVTIQQVAFPQHGLLSMPGTAELLAEAVQSGASVVGGLDPAAEGDPVRYLDTIFGIADRHGAMVDLHLHGHGSTGRRELDLVIERTAALGLPGRVVVSHVYAFGDLDDHDARDLADQLAGAGIGVITAAPYNFPVPPLRLLHEAGVVVGCGHDGIRDLWGPYGTGDMLDRARHIAYRSMFRRDEDIELVLVAATTGGGRLLGGEASGIVPGAIGDLVVVPAASGAEAVVVAPHDRTVVKAGSVVASGTSDSVGVSSWPPVRRRSPSGSS